LNVSVGNLDHLNLRCLYVAGIRLRSVWSSDIQNAVPLDIDNTLVRLVLVIPPDTFRLA
jgi:hypothetical protein